MTALSAAALSVTADDGSRLLADVSVGVEPGETLLVCGPSGSGKTLLVKALKGLLEDRADLAVAGSVERSGRIGYVAQSPRTQLVRRGVRADVAFGPENHCVPPAEIEARIERTAKRLDATRLLDRQTASLSGGEATLVALMGALVMDPAVVLLDEPLASLDDRNRRLVLDALDRLVAADVSLVVAEHDIRDLVGRADRVVLVEDGRIQAGGDPRALMADLHHAGVTVPFDDAVAVERAAVATTGATDPPGGDPP